MSAYLLMNIISCEGSMKKKRIVIILLAAIVIIAGSASYLAKRNYDYGLRLYTAAGSMSVQTMSLADSIEYLEETITDSAMETTDLNRNSFDSALASMRSSFGYDDMPLTNHVRHEWIIRFEDLYEQTFNDDDLILAFEDLKQQGELSLLHDQLTELTIKLNYIRDRFNHLSAPERYLFNWHRELQLLSESVDIS